MEITEINNKKDYIKGSRFIGIGTTAVCFKRKDGRVFKLYIDTPNTYHLFQSDMIERLSNINNIMNDTYIGPKEVLVQDGKVIGYLYPYIGANTLKYINRNISIDQLFNSLDKLIEDTIDISNKGFMLFDVHYKNILFDNRFYVIDLDKGHSVTYTDNLLNHNLKQIYQTIFDTIFRIKPWEIVFFNDRVLDTLYHKCRWDDKESLMELVDYLKFKTNKQDPTIKQLKRSIGYTKQRNDYY